MELFSARSQGYVERLVAYGLQRSQAKEFISLVVKWETNSGPRWTVNRLKSLKQDVLRVNSGQIPLTWVKKNRSGQWSGVLGSLIRMSQISEKKLNLVLNTFMMYSTFLAPSPDSKHIESLKQSVMCPDVELDSGFISDFSKHCRKTLGLLKLGKSISLFEFRGKSSCSSPTLKGSVPQDSELQREIEWSETSEGNYWLWSFSTCYSPVLECLDQPVVKHTTGVSQGRVTSLVEMINSHYSPKVWGGNLVPLNKDGGWKIRWIANPLRIHQLALKPLGDALYDLLKSLPWDCTFDQQKPLASIQSHLQSGGKCYAVDLSSATDYFPLSVQLTALNAIFGEKEIIRLFSGLSRSYWKSPYGEFQWTKGQPMGLYPSFASFALSHGLLLSFMDPRPGQFFVLGDDVIILNESLFQNYLKTLDVLGCPIQSSKTLVSESLTEFAGKVITPKSVISTYKWRDVNSDNFIELMRTFGQRFKTCLRARERKVYEKVSRLLPPYGCNHSTGKSLPLEQVVALTDEFESLLPETSDGARYAGFLRWLMDLFSKSDKSSLYSETSYSWFEKSSRDLDERVSRAFNKSIVSKFPYKQGITDLLERLDLPSDLPALLGETSRTPLLSWYERVLGFEK